MPTQLQFRRGTTAQNNSFTGAVGELSVDTSTKNIRIHDGSNAGGVEVIPAGTILAFGSTTLPANSAGYLKCDGAAVNRTTYARLFAVISTSFGTGDGSSTFNVPDLKDRLPLGLGSNNTGLNAATTGAAASSVVTSAQGTGAISGSVAQGTGAISGNTAQTTAEVDITSAQTAAGVGNLAVAQHVHAFGNLTVEQHAHGVGNLAGAQAAPEVAGQSAQAAVTISGNVAQATANITGQSDQGTGAVSGSTAQHTHAVQGDTAQHAHGVGNLATAQHVHAAGNLAVAQHTHAHTIPAVVIQYIIKT